MPEVHCHANNLYLLSMYLLSTTVKKLKKNKCLPFLKLKPLYRESQQLQCRINVIYSDK